MTNGGEGAFRRHKGSCAAADAEPWLGHDSPSTLEAIREAMDDRRLPPSFPSVPPPQLSRKPKPITPGLERPGTSRSSTSWSVCPPVIFRSFISCKVTKSWPWPWSCSNEGSSAQATLRILKPASPSKARVSGSGAYRGTFNMAVQVRMIR